MPTSLKTNLINIPKCDERHPLCGNCARRFKGLKCCDFDPFVETTKEGKSTASSRKGSPALCPMLPSITNHASDGSRVLELRLMHHYTTTTCGHMPGSQSSMKKLIWSVDIPQLAFHSDLVLSALLGISALHRNQLFSLFPLLDFAVFKLRRVFYTLGSCSLQKTWY
jgi:hypothetical protein